MTLISCPECSNKVSDKAEICPKCGYAIFANILKIKEKQKKDSKDALSGCLILIITLIAVVYWFWPSTNGNIQKDSSIDTDKASQNISKKVLTEEEILYQKVRKIPASEYEKNRDGYKELMEINPNKVLYKEKYLYYENLANTKEKNSNQVVKKEELQSGSGSSTSNTNSYTKLMNEFEKSGAFLKNDVSKSILIETRFWNSLDFDEKRTFCYILTETYMPKYLFFIDKYSGKKLCSRDFMGNIILGKN